MALSLGLWRARAVVTKESAGGDVGAVDAQRANPTYKVLPTRGLTQLLALQWRVERTLGDIATPLCVFHGDRDTTIDPASARVIARRVQSDVVEHHRLRRTQHLVGLDVERDLVSRLACGFVSRQLAAVRHTTQAS
jgi:esterase/lipase